MGDFLYKKLRWSGEPAAERVTLAGTVEAGDLLEVGGTKADAADTAVAWIAMEAGDSGDVINAYPVIPGMILQAKTQDTLTVGEACGIAIEATTNRQIVDDGASNALFHALEAATAEDEDAKVVVTSTGSYWD